MVQWVAIIQEVGNLKSKQVTHFYHEIRLHPTQLALQPVNTLFASSSRALIDTLHSVPDIS